MSAVTAVKPSGETDIVKVLGADADKLLSHVCKGIPKESLHLPGPDFVERVFAPSDRTPPVIRSLQQMFDHGRLGGTGYLSILPVDQGIEHSAGASFAKNPAYFDPENIVRLAIEGGCNAVASTLGVLGSCSRKYAHRIPFLLKVNHNEFLTYPNKYDQILFGSIKQAVTWVQWRSARPFISAPRNPRGSSWKSRRLLKWRTSAEWRLCCGATCAIPDSKPIRTTTSLRI